MAEAEGVSLEGEIYERELVVLHVI
jgi:hypothetical protein